MPNVKERLEQKRRPARVGAEGTPVSYRLIARFRARLHGSHQHQESTAIAAHRYSDLLLANPGHLQEAVNRGNLGQTVNGLGVQSICKAIESGQVLGEMRQGFGWGTRNRT